MPSRPVSASAEEIPDVEIPERDQTRRRKIITRMSRSGMMIHLKISSGRRASRGD